MSERDYSGRTSGEISERDYSRGRERRPSREIREVREIREIKEYGESSGRQVSRANIESRERKRVLVLDGVRIFFDEIKKYGIASKKKYYERIYKEELIKKHRENKKLKLEIKKEKIKK